MTTTIDTFEPSRDWVNNLNKIHRELLLVHDKRSILGINGFKADNDVCPNEIDLITIPYLGIQLLSFNVCLRSVSETKKEGEWTELFVGKVSGDRLQCKTNVPVTNWGRGRLYMARIDENNQIRIHTCGQPVDVGDPMDIHETVQIN